jgi:23S rRNA (guanine745-N1)-methyltransferase
MTYALICPVCSQSLSVDKTSPAKHKSLSCPQGHLFDYAKQGYVNLLLSQHKKSKHPGDTLEMVQARTHFLDSGFYDCISNFLIKECIDQNLFASLNLNNLNPNNSNPYNPSQIFSYADLACGEGFYTHKIHQHLQHIISTENAPDGLVVVLATVLASTGIDISTPAIKAACHRTKEVQWLIASLARIPLQDNSQDLVTGLFFHFDLDEISRILKPAGSFIMVTTGPNHLIELRELIYDKVKEEKLKDFSHVNNDLQHLKTLELKTSQRLNSSEDILSLLAMTPHYWRCTQDKKHALAALPELCVTLDVQFDIFIKNNSL